MQLMEYFDLPYVIFLEAPIFERFAQFGHCFRLNFGMIHHDNVLPRLIKIPLSVILGQQITLNFDILVLDHI